MKVVILCGGKGARLHQETEFRPKPMVEIGGKPILWHIMKIYSHYGFKEFILCLGYKGDIIRQYIANYNIMNYDCTVTLGAGPAQAIYKKDISEDWKITLVNTGLESNTGLRLKMIKPFLNKKAFMVTYGDGLADINLSQLVQFHKTKKKTLTLTGVYPYERYGIIEVNQKNMVNEFLEKPKTCNLVNAGFMVCEPEIFNYINGDVPFEKKPIYTLADKKEVACFKHSGFWHSMDTFRDFLYLNELWNSHKASWKIWKE